MQRSWSLIIARLDILSHRIVNLPDNGAASPGKV